MPESAGRQKSGGPNGPSAVGISSFRADDGVGWDGYDGLMSKREARRISAAEAMGTVRSRQRVYVQGGCAVPRALIDALVARYQELEDVEIVHLHTEGERRTRGRRWRATSATTRCSSARNVREAVNAGRADFTPVFLSEVPRLFADHAAAGRGADPGLAAGQRRLLQPRHLGRLRQAGVPRRRGPSSRRSTAACRARTATASSTSRRSTTWCAADAAADRGGLRASRTRSRRQHRRARRLADRGRRDAADRHRRRSRTPCSPRSAGTSTWACTRRCSRTACWT